jgi:hypothetical protein
MEGTLFTGAEPNAHFRAEFSTYDFLMEPTFEEELEVLDAAYRDGLHAAYTCEWRGDGA